MVRRSASVVYATIPPSFKVGDNDSSVSIFLHGLVVFSIKLPQVGDSMLVKSEEEEVE